MVNVKQMRQRQRQRAERLRNYQNDSSDDSEVENILNGKGSKKVNEKGFSSDEDSEIDPSLLDEYDKEQIRVLRNAFAAFDHSSDNSVDIAEVPTILEMFGQKLDEKAQKKLLSEANPSGAKKIDFNIFCKIFARFIEVEEDADAVARELKEAFRLYDREGKGYLTVAVLRDILHELDDKLSKEDLDMMIDEIDADGSGTVDFDEFMQVMTGD